MASFKLLVVLGRKIEKKKKRQKDEDKSKEKRLLLTGLALIYLVFK